MKNFIKIITFIIKQKMGKNKIKIGESYEILKTPCGVGSSNFTGTEKTATSKFIVKVNGVDNSHSNSYRVSMTHRDGKDYNGGDGWVYEYELKALLSTSEDLKNQIIENEEEISDLNIKNNLLKTKLEFMETQGIENYSDEDFKAYLVLKELGIDDFAKAKNIVKILNG
jgi:hypothetical protein